MSLVLEGQNLHCTLTAQLTALSDNVILDGSPSPVIFLPNAILKNMIHLLQRPSARFRNEDECPDQG